MFDEIFELVGKIVSEKPPSTEFESIDMLRSFLESKHLSGLDLGLKSLIEISINYTNLNQTKYLNSSFNAAFDKNGDLLNQKKYIKNNSKEIREIFDKLKNCFLSEKRLNFNLSEAKGIFIYLHGNNIFTYTSIHEESSIVFGSLKLSFVKSDKRQELSDFLNMYQERINFDNRGSISKITFENLVYIIDFLIVKNYKI